jgi:hypothetical protein
MAHELPVFVHGCLLLLLLRWIVDLSLQVGHSVGQVLQKRIESEKTAAWPDPLVLAVVHCLSYCLVLGMSLEAGQLLIRTWCSPSER